MLFNLIVNELQKLLKKKKFLLMLIIFSVVIFIAFLNTFNGFKLSSNKAQLEIKNNEKILNDTKKQLTDKNLSAEDIQNINNKIEDIEINIDNLKSLTKAQGDDWKNILHKHISNLEKLKNKTSKNNTNHIKSIDDKINIDKYWINHNINPNDYNYKFNATKYMPDIFSFFNILFLPILIVLFCSDTISCENNPPTIKFLLAKPISRGKILLSKFVSSIISILFVLFTCEFLSFLIIGIVFKFGNLLSPMIVGFKFKHIQGIQNIVEIGDKVHIIPIWQFIGEILLLQILFVIACVSVSILISVFAKSSTYSMSINFIIVTILTFNNILIITNSGYSTKSGIIFKILPFLFTTYSDGGMLLTGNINRFTGITFINPKVSILVLMSWTIICYLISHLIFTKRDILV